MSTIGPFEGRKRTPKHLHQTIKNECSKSTARVQSNLRGTNKTVTLITKGDEQVLPDWIIKHIESHKKLANAINDLHAEGANIPADLAKTLKESTEALSKLANKVDFTLFMKAIAPREDIAYADANKLLHPLTEDQGPSSAKTSEWELNFGLLYSAYQRARSPELQNEIRFLMINYLTKAAFLNLSPGVMLSDELTETYDEMLQVGQLNYGGIYQRGSVVQVPLFQQLGLEKSIGSRNEKTRSMIPIDNMEIERLYKIGFTVAPDLNREEEIVQLLVQQFRAHREKFTEENMEFPILFDITNIIGQDLITENNPQKIERYTTKQQQVRARLNEMVKKAAVRLYPDDPEMQKKANNYLKTNMAVISKARITNRLAVIGLHDELFQAEDFAAYRGKTPNLEKFERKDFIQKKLQTWAVHSGVTIGGINFRYAMADRFNPIKISEMGTGRAVEYAVPGKTTATFYERPADITKTNLFQELEKLGQSKPSKTVGPAQILLAKTTSVMIRTLLKRIGIKAWTDLQKNPAKRELIQTAIVRTMHHLAAALTNKSSFREFSQAIDRTHTELTTLLLLFSPFDTNAFSQIYRHYLSPVIPTILEPQTVGIGKSAMNVFAGINAVVMEKNPKPVRICGAHSYYEEAELVGGNKTLNQVLEDASIQKVDLYLGEFYHNIDVDPSHTNYKKGTILQDIYAIFKEKPATDNLTVAIDATLDIVHSQDLNLLLKTFSKEIREGKLNIVVFRSGQKFDMMGMDNYFGSVFYTINNRMRKWDGFDKLKTASTFHTDPLSQQYFCWMAESGPENLDLYKMQIFENSQEILKMVPNALKPAPRRPVSISSFEKGVKTPFIELNINIKDPVERDDFRRWAETRFMELFTSTETLVYRRGSFGFAHPNLTWIEPKMRINPGLDPNENILYKKFFKDVARKVKELELD